MFVKLLGSSVCQEVFIACYASVGVSTETRCALSPLRFAPTGARRRRPSPLWSSLCASTTHATIAQCSCKGREHYDHAFDSVSSPLVLLVCLGGFLEVGSEHQSKHDDDRDHHCWWKYDPFAARGIATRTIPLVMLDPWAVRLRMPRNTPGASRTAAVTPDTWARTRLRTARSGLLKEVSLFQGCHHQQRRSFDDRLGTAARCNRYCSRQRFFQLVF